MFTSKFFSVYMVILLIVCDHILLIDCLLLNEWVGD